MDNSLNDFAAQAAASAQVSGVASKATIIGGTGASIYTLLGGEFTLSLIGIICTVCTFALNWYFKRREYKLNEKRLELEKELRLLAEKRRQMESDARIALMQSGFVPPIFDKSTQKGDL